MAENKEQVFVDGMIVKEAPVDFIVAKVSFKVEDMVKFLNENMNNGWVNVDIKTSKGGKMYAALNDWKPEGKAETSKTEEVEDDLPF